MTPPEQPVIFTIGHSNHSAERFFDLLRAHGIEALIDVRSHPYSRRLPQFRIKNLRDLVREAGMEYRFMGKELGGLPDEDEFYDSDGYVLYHRIAESERFRNGLAELQGTARARRSAIVCAEENPEGCHRGLLIGRTLVEQGFVVSHIRGDGCIEIVSSMLDSRGIDSDRMQSNLFDDPEKKEWTSVRPVRS